MGGMGRPGHVPEWRLHLGGEREMYGQGPAVKSKLENPFRIAFRFGENGGVHWVTRAKKRESFGMHGTD